MKVFLYLTPVVHLLPPAEALRALASSCVTQFTQSVKSEITLRFEVQTSCLDHLDELTRCLVWFHCVDVAIFPIESSPDF